jgi:hypothetical protein
MSAEAFLPENRRAFRASRSGDKGQEGKRKEEKPPRWK